MPAGLLAMADVVRAVNRRVGSKAFEVLWLCWGNGQIRTGEGLTLTTGIAQPGHGTVPACDAYVIPGFWAESAQDVGRVLARHTLFIDYLRTMPRNTLLWSYCMGVTLLAAAGRLNKRHATTTWWFRDTLTERFANVRWDFSQDLLEDGSVTTASGANGYWALIAHHLSKRVHPNVLRDVEQLLLMPRPAALHPAFRPVELMAQRDAQLQRLLALVQTLPAAQLSLNAAASHLAVSSRTLSRRIQAACGIPAGAWLRLAKLRQVSDALIASRMPIKHICAQLGYADEAALHRSFKQATGMTAGQYRQLYARSA